MHILMVGSHACIRIFKQSNALMARGHTVDLLAKNPPFGFDRFNTVSVYHDEEQLKRTVSASRAQIIHVHNEPDWIVRASKEVSGGRPVVYDIHDLESMRWQAKPDEDEYAAFGSADAYVHVSQPCKEAAERYHGNGKPYTILPSYASAEFMAPDPLGDPSWDSIVYEGGLSYTPTVWSTATNSAMHSMRYYGDTVKAFCDQGYNFSIYGPNQHEGNYTYENFGAVVGGGLVYPVLMRALRQHGFGLVGAERSYPLMEAAMPNKLFEYMSQGVVPFCLNASTAADFCEEYGVGIRLNGSDNLKAQLASGPECRENIKRFRHEWTMENHIQQVEGLYQELLS